jgi:hypothetical protein
LAAGLAVVFLAVALVAGWALFVPAADWLARHDIGNATGSNLETARNNARGNILALTAGLAGFGALVFTARNFALQRRSLELSQKTFQESAVLARRTLELTEQGQVTDRYTKAIEQLGSGTLDIRIGGIYALERIARDSARDHPSVIEVLTAFIRERSPADRTLGQVSATAQPRIGAGIEAALRVIRERNHENDIRPIRLNNANLTDGDLPDANLHNANLNLADLNRADLNRADLTRANLIGANLHGANLINTKLVSANLTGANLTGAKLIGAILIDADLTGADLTSVDLRGANLIPTNLSGANLSGANLTLANLSGANLSGANLTLANLSDACLTDANLTSANLTGSISTVSPAPADWRVNGTGRLERNRPPDPGEDGSRVKGHL